MRKYLSLGLATLLSLSVGAQTFTEWQDAGVNAVNRAPMHTDYFAYETPELAARGERATTCPSTGCGNSTGCATPTPAPPASGGRTTTTARGARCPCPAYGK